MLKPCDFNIDRRYVQNTELSVSPSKQEIAQLEEMMTVEIFRLTQVFQFRRRLDGRREMSPEDRVISG